MMSAARGGNFNSFVPLVGEGVSVLSNFAAYSAVQASMQEGPLCTACAGLASGAIMTGIALGTNSRFFPEEGPETLRLQSLSVWKKMLRGAFGYATFFTTFEGLRRGIYKSRLHDTSARGTPLPDRSRDLPWHATNFISGFTAGFAYRCALIPWTQSSGERTPIPLRQHSVIVVRSAAKMGILGLSIGVAEVFLNLDFTTGVWSLEA